MANWQRKLMLQPEWDRADEKEISVQQLAGVIAKRLLALPPFGAEDIDKERDDIAADFAAIEKDADATNDDFNEVMDRLYDWGDTPLGPREWNGRKVCWIDRFSIPPKTE